MSAIIVLMGILKAGVFNKIKSKLLRKVALAWTSVVLVFPCTALYFLASGINFNHYWIGCGLTSILLIGTYWAYENTALRELIHKVGSLTILRFIKFVAGRIAGTSTAAEDKKALQDMTSSLEQEVGNHLAGALGATATYPAANSETAPAVAKPRLIKIGEAEAITDREVVKRRKAAKEKAELKNL